MSIDRLQEKIRKLKNPAMIRFSPGPEQLPPSLAALPLPEGYGNLCRKLLNALPDLIPAVRFSFGGFALLGTAGLEELKKCLARARELGYYIVLDAPELLTPQDAASAAQALKDWDWDGLVLSPYLGSDVIRPFLPDCRQDKTLFLLIRGANRSASELQDLLTGTRLVHQAAAELADRHGQGIFGSCGYSQVGAVVGAPAESALKTLRSRYNRLFLLVDGCDAPAANAKKCAAAFDRFGHGGVVCAGESVTAAWKQGEDQEDYVNQSVQAAQRLKRNLSTYVTIL